MLHKTCDQQVQYFACGALSSGVPHNRQPVPTITHDEPLMHKFGIAINILSIIACIVGLIVGFYQMIETGENNAWLSVMVPGSFLGLMAGMVMSLFSKR